MALRLAVGSLLVAASDALVLGTRARGVVRAPSACADLSAFEKSFMDQADIVDYLDKNRAPVSYTHLTLPTILRV